MSPSSPVAFDTPCFGMVLNECKILILIDTFLVLIVHGEGEKCPQGEEIATPPPESHATPLLTMFKELPLV